MPVSLKFNQNLTISDPHTHPVLIVGQVKHLTQARLYEKVSCKLGSRVNEETFNNAVSYLHPEPTDTCSLYLDLAKIAALPLKSSRHNTSSRAHAITRIVRSGVIGVDETVVVVCERQDLFASGCAVARAFPLYSKKSGAGANKATVNVEFVLIDASGPNMGLTADEVSCLENAAHGIRLAAKIVDAPCNEMNVSGFIEEVKEVAKALGIEPKIIRGEELREKGFGGIYGVGKAANDPPALVVLSHQPAGAKETVAWVGKGIVFDTGGLSIKGKTAMPGMKRDCGGAAGILGAFYAAVKAGFKENLHAIFCLAENSVGPDATRPDDIHVLYSGKSVEINNTDAEGRLVLADGVAYAERDLHACIILDMATLTGAQGIATGKYHAAILANNETWERKTFEAGRKSGDLAYPVPYCPELHFSEFTSAVADMKNSVADRTNAQVSCAGLFINAHLGFDYQGVWLHVDMASPVHCGERATGYGPALLCTLFGHMTNSEMLKSIAMQSTEAPTPAKQARM
ncbi:probable aminopeptidase NPEPL1 [Culicoides brevitarsis]|uniref:probable aminopeptidase NPEPL1 n=1 Tax=Culicoides brevitarsis TaxID=469753 RepID=UPI00307C04AD